MRHLFCRQFSNCFQYRGGRRRQFSQYINYTFQTKTYIYALQENVQFFITFISQHSSESTCQRANGSSVTHSAVLPTLIQIFRPISFLTQKFGRGNNNQTDYTQENKILFYFQAYLASDLFIIKFIKKLPPYPIVSGEL